ncbi:MAG: phosphoribosylformylglycinamidine cyclo-ligase [Acidimicrobiia bacterium]|nr:phosphoribosylformylglycinamidine cyclo-ligase [Acidimicrobiia bacterium]
MSDAYRNAGVDVAAGDALVARITSAVTATWGENVVGGFGGFAGAFRIPGGYNDPVLMMTTDGVGTKLELARRTGRVHGVGRDLVAMCVDDLAAAGARPLAFTDYLAVGSIRQERDAAIVASIAEACSHAGCALIGGETAEHPGTMASDAFDLAGAAVGVAESRSIVTGEYITPGDMILGVASPNLRSNGFSLVRSIIDDMDLDAVFPGDHRSVAEVLLEPAVIYSPAVLAAVATGKVRGLAHVTGGGLTGNVPRALPAGAAASIDTSTWAVPNVFRRLGEIGTLDRKDMFSVFNMGIGFVAITTVGDTDRVADVIAEHGHEVTVIGDVIPGDRTVEFTS